MKKKLKEIKRNCKLYGRKGALIYYGLGQIKKFLHIEIKRSVFYVCDLDKVLQKPDVEFRKLNFADFEKEAHFPEVRKQGWYTPTKIEIIRKRFEKNRAEAYGHFDGENLSSSGWIEYDIKNIGERQLNGRNAFLFDDYTDPRFRGRGYQSAIIAFRLYHVQKAGYDFAWSNVYDYNRQSRRNYLKAGFHPTVELLTVKFKNGKTKQYFKNLL